MTYNGQELREKMTDTFSTMIHPARMIVNMSKEDLAELSGLSESLISEVEKGEQTFESSHYLALASVFDNTKNTEEENIYRALVRILTPEDVFETGDEAEDFTLVRRWFKTFNGEAVNFYDDNHDSINYDDSDDSQEFTDKLSDTELKELAEKYKIYADTSAIEDENFPALVSRLEPSLRNADSTIYVTEASLDELSDAVKNGNNREEMFNLSQSLDFVERHCEDGLIKLDRSQTCDKEDPYEIMSEIFENKKHKFMLITQDEELAEALTKDNEHVAAAYIDDKGDLILWRN